MQYREIRIDLNTEFAEHLTELFWERELNYQECDQSTLDAPPPGRTRFQLYLPLEESPPAPAAPEEAEAEAVDVEELLAAVHEQVPEGAQLQIESRDRHDDEWRDAWKKYFATRRIGRIAIVPSWERQSHKAEPGEITLWLDPGRAFGTGGHATTRLCLSLIDRLHQQAAQEAPLVAELLTQQTGAPQILDAGCGCGVLAIAALKLWPNARALGVDIDPEAVAVTMENAEENGVHLRTEAATTPLDELTAQFPLILANLTGPTLLELAKALAARLLPGGVMLISGVLQTEAAQVTARFEKFGLKRVLHEGEEEWASLKFVVAA